MARSKRATKHRTGFTPAYRTELEYQGFVLDLGSNTYLQLDLANVVGTPTVTLQLGSLASGNTLTGTLNLTPGGTPATYVFDITLLPDYSPLFITQIDRIVLIFQDPADGDFSVEAVSAEFSAVPEPGIWALLGMGVGFGLILWRRQRSVRRVLHSI